MNGDIGREARPAAAAVAATGTAVNGDAWPPLAQRQPQPQQAKSAADSCAASRESRVDQVVRMIGVNGEGEPSVQGGSSRVDSSGGRTPTRLASVAVTRPAEGAAASDRP